MQVFIPLVGTPRRWIGAKHLVRYIYKYGEISPFGLFFVVFGPFFSSFFDILDVRELDHFLTPLRGQ